MSAACIEITRGALVPRPGSTLASSTYTTSPFESGNFKVQNFLINSQCTSNGPRRAPTCNWTVSLSYCKRGGSCDNNDKSFVSGTFKASGTGPAAYNIQSNSGTGKFASVSSGTIDSVFNVSTRRLNNVNLQLCFPDNCCSWDLQNCQGDAWCSATKDRCEGPCNGSWIDPISFPSSDFCCSWDRQNCQGSAWCSATKDRCEGACNGSWINPQDPPPSGCCSWNPPTCEGDAWCSATRDRCEGPCNGQWIV